MPRPRSPSSPSQVGLGCSLVGITGLLPLMQVLIPLFTGQPLPPEKLQEVMDGLTAALDQFEGLFLQDKPFLVGSEVSLADLVAIVDLMQVTLRALGPRSPPPASDSSLSKMQWGFPRCTSPALPGRPD